MSQEVDVLQQVKTAVEFWESLYTKKRIMLTKIVEADLASKTIKLEKQALEIAEHREKSTQSRKKLATGTKGISSLVIYVLDFKKATDQEKLTNFNKLLKSYQDEIDSLTRRSMYVKTIC